MEVSIVSKFTPEEEKRIQAEVKKKLKKDREAQIQAEINNRVAAARSKKPGYSGY